MANKHFIFMFERMMRSFAMIIIGCQLVAFVLVVLLLLAIRQDLDKILYRDIPSMEKAMLVENAVQRQYVRLLWLLHSKNMEEIEELSKALSSNSSGSIQKIMDELVLLPDEGEQKKLINEYALLRQQFLNCRRQEVIPLKEAGKDEEAIAKAKEVMQPLYNRRTEVITAFSTNERKVAESVRESIKAKVFITMGVLTVMLLLLLVGALRFFKEITDRYDKERTQKRQADQLEAMKVTVSTVRDIVNNSLTSLQYFGEVASSGEKLTSDDLKSFEATIHDMSRRLKELSLQESFEIHRDSSGNSTVKNHSQLK